MMLVRPAAVAGMFYPGDRNELARAIADMLEALGEAPLVPGFPKGVIVPHAGYIYSGPVAASAYGLLRPAAGIVNRVVLLGPCHRVPVRGLALPAAAAFATPLGKLDLDEDGVAAIRGLPQVGVNSATHAYEHALEVQLPFLQEVLGRFALVPLVVGDATVAEVAEVIERLWGGPETLIVISSDLSHYLDYEQARAIDRSTVAAMLDYRTDIDHMHACGATPVTGFLAAAKRHGVQAELLDMRNSGDTAGERDRVVGYAALAFWERRAQYDEIHGRTLLALARASVAHALGGPSFTIPAEPWLAERRASFVTLMQDNDLRGCVGSLEAKRSLGADVVENAPAAALFDRRFPRLTARELRAVSLEVSILSAPTLLKFSHERELFDLLRPGIDGVILERASARATYLPQVWEDLFDPAEFLASLIQKAGLPTDTALTQCKVCRYRVKKWREADLKVH